MGARTREWNREEFLDRITPLYPDAVVPAERLLDWADSEDGITVRGGRGSDHPSIALRAATAGGRRTVAVARLRDCYTSARLQVVFGHGRGPGGSVDERLRAEFRRRFEGETRSDVEPSVSLGRLVDDEAMSLVRDLIRDLARRAD